MNPLNLTMDQWALLDEEKRRSLLKRPVADTPGLQLAVKDIIEQVRQAGDDALFELTGRFDGVSPELLEVDPQTLTDAKQACNTELIEAINDASERIRLFHAADIPADKSVETAKGLNCTVTYRPLSRVGIYVPGGTAPLISTVMMLAIPAKLAGCDEVVMCSPPGPDGKISSEVLAAASLCAVDRVFCVGGAQAIAAMAYGTETIPRCRKIFGPGNAWVTAAKQQVSQDPDGAAIDMPAGPSEVMVIADQAAGDKNGIEFITWDLLSQAEHGPDSQVILLTDCPSLAQKVIERLDALVPGSARRAILEKSLAAARIILVSKLDEAMGIANDYAPEHLIINTENARQLASRVENAGSVFVGRWTPESLGDYCSGTNHVLPTYGFARAHGALGVGDFMRRMTLQEASPESLALVGPCAEILAQTEGLEAHRMAVRSRLDSLESQV